MLKIKRPEFVKQFNDLVAAEIGGITERRPPVIVSNACVFVQELRIVNDDFTNGFDIVAPDRVDQLACLNQTRPGRSAVCGGGRALSA